MLSGLSPLAREARAWPFEQARNLLAHLLKVRLDSGAERDLAAGLIDAGKIDEALAALPALARAGGVRDRLRRLGPAAHRHLRRGGAHRPWCAPPSAP